MTRKGVKKALSLQTGNLHSEVVHKQPLITPQKGILRVHVD